MRSTSGSRTCSIIARIFWRRAPARRDRYGRASTSSIWRPDRNHRVERRHRLLKDHRHPGGAQLAAAAGSVAVSSSSPTSLTLPLEGHQARPSAAGPITVNDVTDLPEPLSPDHTQRSRLRAPLQRDAVDDALAAWLFARGRQRDFRCRERRCFGWARSLAGLPLFHARIERIRVRHRRSN